MHQHIYIDQQQHNSYSIFQHNNIHNNSSQMRLDQLLNLQYINIQSIPELKSIIQEYNTHIDIKLKQIQQLGHIRDKNKAENEVIVSKMYAMQKQNLKKTRNYQQGIQQSNQGFQARKIMITDQHDRNLKNAQTKFIQSTHILQNQLANLSSQYSKLSQFEVQQEQFLNQIKQKSLLLITQQYQHHDNMNKQQSKQLEQNKALILKNKDLIKQLKRDVKLEAGRIVYQDKYMNEDKNYELKVKLFQLQEEVTKLRYQRNQIVKSRNEQKINSSLNQEQIEQYKAVGGIQKSKIKMYNDKVQSLKKTITNQISKLETKIKEKKNKWQNELKGSKLRLFNLQKQKQQLKINLQRYKILGQTILMQRQQVQQFFLMAIESCKRQMTESGGMTENIEKQYGQKVDIEQLLPKDKHRIITNLYTKLALAPNR